MELFTEAFWPDHPLGRPILGTKRIASRASRATSWRASSATSTAPANILIAAAGHLEHGEASALIQRHFGALDPGGASRQRRRRRGPATRHRDPLQEGAGAGPPLPGRSRLRAGPPRPLRLLHPQHRPRRQHVLAAVPERAREARARLLHLLRGQRPTPTPACSRSTPARAWTRWTRCVRLTVEELRRLKARARTRRRAAAGQGPPQGQPDALPGEHGQPDEPPGPPGDLLPAARSDFDEILAGIEAVEADDVQRIANQVFADGLAVSVLGNLGRYRPKRTQLRI